MPSEEIKTAIQLKIFGRQERDGTTWYTIKLWSIFEPNVYSKPAVKRYNNFYTLHSDLMQNGYENLPALPSKKIGLLMNENDKQDRQQ